jgi:hypothetical protein
LRQQPRDMSVSSRSTLRKCIAPGPSGVIWSSTS